ncbi:MAG: SurA N-terminal domain-containing protein, partial [Pseudomonadota bacterium]|nr:SurA N-terminal domain-containing protein [Pseudomonadota bacterium]
MLQIIRSHMLGWFAKILVGFISLAFAIFGVESYLVSQGGDNALAKVNGEKITADEVTTAYNRLRNGLMNQYGKDFRITTDMQEKLHQEALQQLITREIIFQQAAKDGFKSSPLAVHSVVQHMPAFQQDGAFSPELFGYILNNLNYTQAGFFKDMSETLTISQLIDGITRTSFALPDEIVKAYLLAEQKRDFKFMVLSLAKAEAKIDVSQQEISSYYQSHTKQFQSEESVNVEYVELVIDDILARQVATEKEIQEYYNNNPEYFSTPARWQVAKMLVPLTTTADAKTVEDAQKRAKLIAQQLKAEAKTPAAATVAWVSPDKEHVDLVKQLAGKKVGDVTGIAREKEGLVVYKIVAQEERKVLPFEEVKDKVKTALLKHNAEQEFSAKSDQLAEIAFTSPDSLQPLSNALKLPIKQSTTFTQRGSKDSLGAFPKVVNAAFSDAVLQQSGNSEPIEVKNGQIVVLRIKQHNPVKTLGLAEVQAKITTMLKKQKALAAVKKEGENLLAELSAGKNADALVKAQNSIWQEKVQATRQESGLDRAILHLAFKQPAPEKAHAKFSGEALTNGDYAIVSVEKIHNADKNKLTEQERKVYA